MPFLVVLLAALCTLVMQGCATPRQNTSVPARQFTFADGGQAAYFVVDKRHASDGDKAPSIVIFVVGGSDCISFQPLLPAYFNGLDAKPGSVIRLFLLQKRFVAPSRSSDDCGQEFIEADHPSRWIADQAEFMRTQLDMARINDQWPRKIVALGISEGAEVAPVLALRIPSITHVSLLANGGMDPVDAFRLQADRYGFSGDAAQVVAVCNGSADSAGIHAAGRTCRYWQEMQATRQMDNLLTLDIPVFAAMGETDRFVPIESLWLLRNRFAAAGKHNLTTYTVPGADHDFRQDGVSQLHEVLMKMQDWLQQ